MQNKINAFLIFLGLIHSIVIGLNVPADFCDGFYNNTLPHPEHCTHFVYCLNESPFVFKCEPPKNIFYQDQCVAGDPVHCIPLTTTTSTTTPTTTTSTPTTTTPTPTTTTTTTTTTTSTPTTTTTSTSTTTTTSTPTTTTSTSTPATTTSTPTTTTSTSTPTTTTSTPTTTTSTSTPTTTSTSTPTTTTSTSTTTTSTLTTTTSTPTTTTSTSTPTTTTSTSTPTTTSTSTSTTTTSTPTTTTTSTPTTTTTESSLLIDICDGISFDTLPHPNNCFQFVVCINEVASIIDCRPSEVFYDGSCVKGDPKTCEAFTLSTDPTTTTTEEISGPDQLCIGNNFEFIPNQDCNFRFFYCMFGVAIPGECAADKVFNEQFRGCIDGDRNQC